MEVMMHGRRCRGITHMVQQPSPASVARIDPGQHFAVTCALCFYVSECRCCHVPPTTQTTLTCVTAPTSTGASCQLTPR
jgi:hypothetical protein